MIGLGHRSGRPAGRAAESGVVVDAGAVPGGARAGGVVGDRTGPARGGADRPAAVRRGRPRTGGSTRVAALLAMLAGWLVVGVLAAVPALAHAQLLSTDPPDGARLSAAPSRVSLTFSEKVGLDVGFVHVVDSHGRRVDQGTAQHPDGKGDTASVGLGSGLGDGGYIISYRVVSADAHPINGAVAFTVGNGPLISASGAVTDSSGTNPVVNALFTATRWVSFAGLVLLGGLVFVVVCWPGGRTDRRARRVIWTGWGLAAGSAAASVLLQGPYASGQAITSLFSTDLLSNTLGTTYGRMQSIRLIVLGALAVLMVRLLRHPDDIPEQARARDEDLSAILGLVVLATYGASGHAVAGIQPTLAVLSDIAHLAAMSGWIGGLVLLVTCLLPSDRADELAETLPKFSRFAFSSVVVLAATGTYQAWREVGTLPAMLATGYGKLLSFKILAFVLLVSLGNLGRLFVRRRYVLPVAYALASSGPPGTEGSTAADEPADESTLDELEAAVRGGTDRPALRRLRTSVGLEVGVATVVLALTAVLVAAAPARGTYVKPFQATLKLPSNRTAQLSMSPARAGLNTVDVYVFDAAGKKLEARQVGLSVALPAQSIGPLPIALTKVDTGHYRSTTVSLPSPGSWTVDVQVSTSEFDNGVAETQVDVR